jgi:hypothetical protein
MPKAIISVGIPLAADIEQASFTSNASLSDWDIVLFRPYITDLCDTLVGFDGKPWLDGEDGVQLSDAIHHWGLECIEAANRCTTQAWLLRQPFSRWGL